MKTIKLLISAMIFLSAPSLAQQAQSLGNKTQLKSPPQPSSQSKINPTLIGRWEQDLANCKDPPDYALNIEKTSFSSFAHSCKFTTQNLFPNGIRGKMQCEYFGEGAKPKNGFNMNIELTGRKTLRFWDSGRELVTYYKCKQ